MVLINNINLLVSTSRYNEINAEAELWFSLLICGDKYPIISSLSFPGLVVALSNLDVKEVIKQLKEVLTEDPEFFKYILKIVPIDYICETDISVISQIVLNNYKKYIDEGDSFRITLKRRKHDLIDRDEFISIVANNIKNKVNLENPDKIIRFDILGNYCGISFLKQGDIIRTRSEKYVN